MRGGQSSSKVLIRIENLLHLSGCAIVQLFLLFYSFGELSPLLLH